MELKWYAVYTKPSCEKKVIKLLRKMKIESYCPSHSSEKKKQIFKKRVWEPLLPSFVFARVYEHQLPTLRQVNGVINLIYWLNKPAIIYDKEIETIHKFLKEYKSVRLEKSLVNLNDTMRVTGTSLQPYDPEVVPAKNNTVQVVLPSLGYLITGSSTGNMPKREEVLPQKGLVSLTNSEHKYAI